VSGQGARFMNTPAWILSASGYLDDPVCPLPTRAGPMTLPPATGPPGIVKGYLGSMRESEFVDVRQRLRAALTPADLDQTLVRITAAAVEVLPDVEYASITIRHADGRLETSAPTDDLVLSLDAAQYEFHEGPCYEAATDTVHVTSPHLASDPRWPRYAPVALAAGVQAQAGVRLFDAKESNGALNLYSRNAGSFEELDGLGQLFSHQAATAIDYAREITHLQQAVRTRQAIGQAVGIVTHGRSRSSPDCPVTATRS
jgi:hypothetical protein